MYIPVYSALYSSFYICIDTIRLQIYNIFLNEQQENVKKMKNDEFLLLFLEFA